MDKMLLLLLLLLLLDAAWEQSDTNSHPGKAAPAGAQGNPTPLLLLLLLTCQLCQGFQPGQHHLELQWTKIRLQVQFK
jgi:hypothetical protein